MNIQVSHKTQEQLPKTGSISYPCNTWQGTKVGSDSLRNRFSR